MELNLAGRLSKYDVVVTGIEVTQGIQVQETPYYSGSVAADACKVSTGKGKQVCSAAFVKTLMDPNVCGTLPSLPARNVDDLAAPIHYKVDESNETPQWLLGPNVLPSQQKTGVALVAGRKTVVRVFASLVGSASGKSVPSAPVRLYGKRNGKPISGYLSPDYAPASIKSSVDPVVTCQQRADSEGAYTFTLPPEWTEGTLELRAKLVPEGVVFGEGGECGSETCVANNSLTVDRIGFTKLGYTTITPVLTLSVAYPVSSSPEDVFSETRYHMPGRTYFVEGSASSYAGAIFIDDIIKWHSDPDSIFYEEDEKERKRLICSGILGRLIDWGSENDRGDQTVAVIGSGNICPGVSDGDNHLFDEQQSFAVVPATSIRRNVPHELFHGIGRPHADSACGGGTGSGDAEGWPPDQRGHIHGIGLDTRRKPFRPYRVLAPANVLSGSVATGQPDEWFDFMSYCSSKSNNWISDRGWNDAVRLLRKFHQTVLRTPLTHRANAASSSARLRVVALEMGSEVGILSVVPAPRTSLRGGNPSAYRLIARDERGVVLSNAQMALAAIHDHGNREQHFLRVDVPLARVASVEIVRGGRVLARRARSVRRPIARIVEPRGGTRVGNGRTVIVRWTASDANGDSLQAKIDYSTDRGSSWQAIVTGATRGRAVLPTSLFSGSKKARIRVRVSDGFNETAAVSGIFTVVARKPTVRIHSPARRQRLPGDTTLFLEGEAYDDRGTVLRGKRLTWFDGERKLGVGERLSVSGLRPGMRILRLRADDGRGGVANAFVRVQLTSTRPHLLSLKAPDFVKTSARTVALTIATTVPATLQVGGQTFKVGPKAKRISVRVKPGRQRLELALKLSAGRTNTVTLVIRRR